MRSVKQVSCPVGDHRSWNRLFPFAVAWLGAGMLLAGAADRSAAAADRSAAAPYSPDSLYDRGTARAILVHQFEIGVVVPPRADSLALVAAADSAGLRSPQRFPEGLTVYSVDDTVARGDLVGQIRLIRRQGRFLRVGLVISKTPASEPMIVTDEIVIRLRPQVSPDGFDGVVNSYGLRLIRENPFQPRIRRYALPDSSSFDAISLCQVLTRHRSVDYAFPNLVHVVRSLSGPTDEPLYNRQWHLENTGLAGGTPDADIDAAEAWAMTTGSSAAVIAVIDGGFDLTNRDISENLWVNPNETACNGKDEDDTGSTKYIDDMNGWDFYDCDYGCGSSAAGTPCYACDFDPATGGDCSLHIDATRCGDLELKCLAPISVDIHGTAVAGVAAARGDNDYGVTGIAPMAKLMLLRRAIDSETLAEPFDYAANKGAWIINCSWWLTPAQILEPELKDAIINAAESGRGGKGCVIVFAMSNDASDNCNGTPDNDLIYVITKSDGRDAVIAVSGSNNRDEKVTNTGIGDCGDVLAPTYGGTLYVATTDHVGGYGYNDTTPLTGSQLCVTPVGVDRESPEKDFTYCFTGTSAAAPMVSGTAALILSANSDLTSSDVQRLLQDTADKIEDNMGTAPAKYSETTGYSNGASGVPTHGYGRLNAYEAVRVASAVSSSGRGGTDLFLRDHALDWGNTEKPTYRLPGPTPGYRAYWECADIKVDAGPAWQPTPTTSADFDALTEEDPAPGAANRIYVRVRNRGFVTAAEVKVKLHWAYCATSLPPLPADFWDRFPDDASVTTQWHPIGMTTLTDVAYSGASSTRPPESDGVQIAMVDFTAPALDPLNPTHLCLFGVLHSEQDRCDALRKTTLDPEDFIVDWITPRDNNLGQKNLQLASVGGDGAYAEKFYVRNTSAVDEKYVLRFPKIPDWTVIVDSAYRRPFLVKAGSERLVTVRGKGGKGAIPTSFELTQALARTPGEPLGGITIRLVRP